jgi:hypothetical protein
MPSDRTKRRQQLTAAFIALMARARKPVRPIETAPDQRGPRTAAYRITRTGETIRLRTGKDGWLMSHARTVDPNADMVWLGETDFVGFVYPKPNAPNTAVGFLIPAAVASDALRDAQIAYLASPPTRGRDPNRANTLTLRAINFEGNTEREWYGFAQRWQRYCIGEIEIPTISTTSAAETRQSLAESVARHKVQLAAETGYPVSAIHITFGD